MEHDSDEDEAESEEDDVEATNINDLPEIESPQQRPSRPSLSHASPVDGKGRVISVSEDEPC